jgi:hypothetical protein
VSAPPSDELLPAVRPDGVSVEDLGDEILVYDRESDTAHCLTATAATIWRACAERLTLPELLANEPIDEPTVQRALDELREQELLAPGPLHVHRSGEGISRRQAVGRLAALAAGPLVISVAAPTAWAAGSATARAACVSGSCTTAGTVPCKNCGQSGRPKNCSPLISQGTGCESTKTGPDCYQNGCCPTGWQCSGFVEPGGASCGQLTCTPP